MHAQAECTCAVVLSSLVNPSTANPHNFRRGEIITGQTSNTTARFVSIATKDLLGNTNLPIMYFSNPTRHDHTGTGAGGGDLGFQPGEIVVGTMTKCSIKLGTPLMSCWTGAILANNCDLHTQRGGKPIGNGVACARY